MILFLDSSFCVALYLREVGTDIAARTVRTWPGQVCMSAYGELEVTNAFRLRLFRQQVTEAEAALTLQAFEHDIKSGVLAVEPLTSVVLTRAKRVALEHTAELGTRTLDVIHVAAALSAGADQFASFDGKQRDLAKKLGLKVTPRQLVEGGLKRSRSNPSNG